MRSSANWIPVVVIFVLPLITGVGLILGAFRLRRKWLRIATGTVGVLFAMAFAIAMISFGPYIWASHLESKWQPANPKTIVELESFLSLYSQKDIQPSQSLWGRDYRLQTGERMTQYLLLWKEPLDVVYDSGDRIIAIYTSYE